MLRHSSSSHPAASSGVPSGGADGWHVGDLYRRTPPELMKDPVGPIGRMQVIVEQPAYGLPLLSPGVIARGTQGRVATYEVVEAELAIGGPGEQVAIEQGDEDLLRLGGCAVGQRSRGRQAETCARAGSQPPEEPLMIGFQRPVGQIEGGRQFRARRAGATRHHRGLRQFLDQAVEAHRAVAHDPAGGELDREGQPPAQFHHGGDLIQDPRL